MPPADDDDDPAVYGSGAGPINADEADVETEAEQGELDDDETNMETGEGMSDEEEDDEEQEDFDGILLNLTPTFNTLSLVLRDEGVMKFVKYLSASAGGSRFDIQAEFQVGTAISEDVDAMT